MQYQFSILAQILTHTEIHVIYRCHLLSNKTFYCERGIHFINHGFRTANELMNGLSFYPIIAAYFS